jgi:phosphohistidine phosphatase
VFDDRLYGAGAAELLARLGEVSPEVAVVMLIGHQPAIGDLALSLVGPGPGLEQLSGKFPTAALATFAVPAWPELAPGSGRLLEMVRPKRLPD